MFFKGTLEKFNPSDLIMFLANIGKEGVLAVSRGEENLNISIRKGLITDVYSDRADGKMLRGLRFRGLIDERRMAEIGRMKKETGIKAAHILAKMTLIEKERIAPEMKMSLQEVLLQFFLMETGSFQFLDMPVESDASGVSCQGVILEMARQVDEWRDIEKTLGGLKRTATSRVPAKALEKVPYPARHILEAATGRPLVEIIEGVPIQSYQAITLIARMHEKKLLTLDAPVVDAAAEKKPSPQEALLQSFKKAYGHLLEPKGNETRIDKLVSFCNYYFEKTAVITIRDERVVRCEAHARASGGMTKKEIGELDLPAAEDPVLASVHLSGVAFFGRLNFSDLMTRLLELPPSGECALIPVERNPRESLYLFALSVKESPSAFQYLKFFSEMMASAETGEPGARRLSVSERVARLVEDIDDIPPMSQVITRVLQLLSEPGKSMADLAAALSEDQAMVARILRVSNSPLYRSVQEVRSLNSALSRLGIRAVRSILLSSATRDLLISEKNPGDMWNRILWQHAKESALAARRIAERMKYPDPEEAFVGGMLHDMGKIVILLKQRDLFQQIRKLQTGKNMGSVEAERFVLGFSHTDIGGLLMEKWRMPEILTTCLQYHHQPDAAGEGERLAWIVAYATCLSNLHGLNESPGTGHYTREVEALRHHFSMDEVMAEAFEHVVMEDFKKSDIFD